MKFLDFKAKTHVDTCPKPEKAKTAGSLLCRIKGTAEAHHSGKSKKNEYGEVIAVTFSKKAKSEEIAEKIKTSNDNNIILLHNDQDYKSFQSTQKQKKTKEAAQTIVAVEPSKWPSWKKINHKLLSPKGNSVFVIDNSMEVMYCADGEIKVSSKGKIKKEYKRISFF